MNKKIVVRTVIGLFAIAVLFLVYKWIENITKDPDVGRTDTTDMVAAVEYTDDGSQVVLFDAAGKKTIAPGVVKGRNDIDPVWRPDGQRVFFVSTRKGTSNSIFRWNVATNSVEQRLMSSRSAGSPHFGPPDWPNLMNSGLITLGGNMFDYNQFEQRTLQVLPPIEFASTDETSEDQMSAAYQRIGSSFKSAKWGKDRKVMFAIMRREDDEVFIVNFMQQIGEFPPGPVPIFAGQSLQFDVAADGTAVLAVQGFEFADTANIPEDMVVNGTAIKPWRNGLLAIKVEEDGKITPTPLFIDSPDLGIQPEEITAEARAEHGIPAGVSGIYVADVAAGSAGETIGLKAGDVVTAIKGAKVDSFETMVRALTQVQLGVQAPITYWSAAEKASKTVEYAFGGEASMALRDPTFSPDSKSVAAVVGFVRDKYTFDPVELVIVPVAEMGINQAVRVLSGRVFEPSWNPTGERLAFVMVGEGGDSQIYVIGRDGSGMKNLSGPGQYGSPKFSPAMKGS